MTWPMTSDDVIITKKGAEMEDENKTEKKAARKPVEHICNNCRLYNREKGECKVAVLIEGNEYHMPVFPGDRCHMEQLGIEVQQVR